MCLLLVCDRKGHDHILSFSFSLFLCKSSSLSPPYTDRLPMHCQLFAFGASNICSVCCLCLFQTLQKHIAHGRLSSLSHIFCLSFSSLSFYINHKFGCHSKAWCISFSKYNTVWSIILNVMIFLLLLHFLLTKVYRRGCVQQTWSEIQ